MTTRSLTFVLGMLILLWLALLLESCSEKSSSVGVGDARDIVSSLTYVKDTKVEAVLRGRCVPALGRLPVKRLHDHVGTMHARSGRAGSEVITGDQILLHLIGDYVTQSDWMATEKTKRFLPAAVHALVYSLGFLILSPSLTAWLAILVSHFFIDRYRLARYLVWAKNWLAPRQSNIAWVYCSKTGYPPDRPDWLAVRLLIIADNCIHLCCNGLALKFL